MNPEFGVGTKKAIKEGDAVRIQTSFNRNRKMETPATPEFAKKTAAGGRRTKGKGTGRAGNKRVVFEGPKRTTGSGQNSDAAIRKYGTKSEKQALRRRNKKASRGMAKGKAMV